LDRVDDALRTAIVREGKGDGRVLDGIRRVGNAYSLIGSEIEELVFLNWATHGGSELVAVQERHLRGDIRRGIIKERSRIHHAVLKLFIDLSMHLVGTRFGEYADVGATIDSLPRVIHGRVHGDLLDPLSRRRG